MNLYDCKPRMHARFRSGIASLFSRSMAVAGLCLSLLACSDDAREQITEFPVEQELKGEGIAPLNAYPGLYAIAAVGDKYLFTRAKSSHIFWVADGEFRMTDSLAVRGNGSNEFWAPLFMGESGERDAQYYIRFLDRASQKYYEMPLVSHSTARLVDDLSGLEMRSRYIFQLNDTSYIGAFDYDDSRLFTWNVPSNQVVLWDRLHDFRRNDLENQMISQHLAALRPDKERIAVAYFNLPVLDIRKTDGETVVSLTVGEAVDPSDIDLQDPVDYFHTLHATERYIYALYSGVEGRESGKHYVLIFDWDGKPLCRLGIQGAADFTVDEKHNRIIVLNEDDTEFVGTAYQIPDF